MCSPVFEMTRMIEITRSYADIAGILQQAGRHAPKFAVSNFRKQPNHRIDLRKLEIMRALDTAATGMAAMDLQVQVIAGNLANMTTTGFKSQRAEFQDLIYEHVQRIGAQASENGNILPVGIELGSGVKTVGTPRLMTQGSLAQTGNTLDVAIQGSGWFKILMPDGTFSYTRDGSFQMDNQGRVVTAEGNLVQPTITIPPNSTGYHQPAGPGLCDPPGARRRASSANLRSRPSSTMPACRPTATTYSWQRRPPARRRTASGRNGAGTLLQGSLEQSNVYAVTEISNLIAAQRAYEMNSKVITAADEMLQTTAQLMK